MTWWWIVAFIFLLTSIQYNLAVSFIHNNTCHKPFVVSEFHHIQKTCESICSVGHWPIKHSCVINNYSIDVASNILNTVCKERKIASYIGNIDECFVGTRAIHSLIIPTVIIFILPQSVTANHMSLTSFNYYVTHIDVLLPLWVVLRKMRASKMNPLLMPFTAITSSHDSVDLHSRAFQNRSSFWLRSLQLLSDTEITPLTLDAMNALVDRSSKVNRYSTSYSSRHSSNYHNNKDTLNIHFNHVTFGLPSLNRPRHNTVKAFSQKIRAAALMGTVYDLTTAPHGEMLLHAEKLICSSAHKRVGVVSRAHNRRIANEAEVLSFITQLSSEWCATQTDKQIFSKATPCSVQAVLLTLGSSTSSVEGDILALQSLSVMLGVQGSGMINGLYLPRTSSAVAVYLRDGWPLSTGRDPLDLLAARGPYTAYVNANLSCVICQEKDGVNIQADKFCDNGDIVLEESVVRRLVLQALSDHESECRMVLGV